MPRFPMPMIINTFGWFFVGLGLGSGRVFGVGRGGGRSGSGGGGLTSALGVA